MPIHAKFALGLRLYWLFCCAAVGCLVACVLYGGCRMVGLRFVGVCWVCLRCLLGLG